MKKILALVLALIMTFSLCTVAFAEGEAADETTTTEAVVEDGTEEGTEEAGDFDWLLDLPFWTVKGGAKMAKIALKLVIVIVKVGSIFGLVDTNDIIGQIMDLIASSQNGDAEAEETTTAPETTAAPVVA